MWLQPLASGASVGMRYVVRYSYADGGAALHAAHATVTRSTPIESPGDYQTFVAVLAAGHGVTSADIDVVTIEGFPF